VLLLLVLLTLLLLNFLPFPPLMPLNPPSNGIVYRTGVAAGGVGPDMHPVTPPVPGPPLLWH
jgi:hypothetical protein